jgi:hypothetical protein
MHPLCLSAQLRNVSPLLPQDRERTSSRSKKVENMRIMEAAVAGVVALAAQVLTVAVVMI